MIIILKHRNNRFNVATHSICGSNAVVKKSNKNRMLRPSFTALHSFEVSFSIEDISDGGDGRLSAVGDIEMN